MTATVHNSDFYDIINLGRKLVLMTNGNVGCKILRVCTNFLEIEIPSRDWYEWLYNNY